jgi:tRNA(Ile)-lysidine synthase
VTISVEQLLDRTTFGHGPLHLAVSGGADSTALALLAHFGGYVATVHHVDHGLRPGGADEARGVAELAERLGFAFSAHTIDVTPGPNLEARARALRFSVLPPDVATGHTANDRAASVLINLLRGAGSRGLSTLRPGPRHPIVGLTRAETEALCEATSTPYVTDPTNSDEAYLRNAVRRQLLPLASQLAGRDVVSLLNRSADLLHDDDAFLDALAEAELPDPLDVEALRAAPVVLRRRRLRQLLDTGGYAPSVAELDRVNEVVSGHVVACELSGGRRVARSKGRLIVD